MFGGIDFADLRVVDNTRTLALNVTRTIVSPRLMNTNAIYRWLAFAVICWCSASSASADIITTYFAANNGQSGNMFDINVLVADGVVIQAFDLNLAGGTWDVNVFTLDGSYVGSETNSAAWTLVDSVTGLASAGVDNPTFWDIADLSIDSGLQAFYIEVTNGTGIRYTNGTGEGNLVSDDGNIQIFEGTGNLVNFGTQFRPRVWNGSIHYAVPEPGAALFLLCSSSVLWARPRRRKQG